MAVHHERQSPTLANYFSRLARVRPLERDEELTLARQVRGGDARAANELVSANLGIVVLVAKRYRHLGLAFEDLLAEGNVGLVEAVRRFDPARGTKFITYAIWWIRRAILKALNEQTTIVRVSYHQKKKLREIRRAESRLAHELLRAPELEELSATLEETPAALDRVRSLGVYQIDIDRAFGDDDGEGSLGDTFADPAEVSAEERLIRQEIERLLARALDLLTDKERQVIEGRFGLSGEPCATLSEIGKKMALSRERVRQIEVEARRRLKNSFDPRWQPRIRLTPWAVPSRLACALRGSAPASSPARGPR